MSNKNRKKDLPQTKVGKPTAIISIIIIALVYAGIAVFINTAERPTIAPEEQRVIDKCPAFTIERYISGEFTEKFTKYYNDAVPERSRWKLFIADFRSKLGIEYDDGVEIIGTK